MDSYCALMADLVASRDYQETDRDRVQQNLDRIVKSLNEIYCQSLVKPVMFSGGDEVQGLFSRAEDAYEYARLLRLSMLPAQVRIGIGIGEWRLRMDDVQSTKQDGPVYHFARKAMDQLKTQRSPQGIHFCCADEAVQTMLNGIYGLVDALERRQSKGQRSLFVISRVLFGTEYYQGNDEYNLKAFHLLALLDEIHHPDLKGIKEFSIGGNQGFWSKGRVRIRSWLAQETGTSEQNISKQIRAGCYEEIIQGEKALVTLLKREFGEAKGK